ncbi:protein HtrL [Ditylenchus destructor]|nr:protein HtrL [Ditylenchus destructor]
MVRENRIYFIYLCTVHFTEADDAILTPSIYIKPPVEHHNLTLVTALYDIHREKWPKFSRNQTKYHNDMKNVLRLRIPMVIFVDSKNHAFMKQTREEFGLSNITKILLVPFEELPLYVHKEHIEKIQQRELAPGGWSPEWDEAMKTHPESFSPEYDMLVNTKIHFIHTAMTENHFGTEFFSWIDAGFSHLYPEKWKRPGAFDWYPKFPRGKITMLKRTTKADKVTRYTLKDLYHKELPEVLNAGLIAGDNPSITKFNKLFYEELETLIKRDMIEDEQVVFVLVAAKHPELFNLVEKDCGPDLFTKGDECVVQGDAFDLLRRMRRFIQDTRNFLHI